MYDQFKAEVFSGSVLLSLTEELRQAGWEVTETWKKGNRKLEGYEEKANFFQLEINGKWFFRQVRNKGFVRLNKLGDDKLPVFLRLLKKHQLYSRPEWGLGIALYFVYVLLVFILGVSRDEEWMSILFFVCALCLTAFLFMAYLRSKGEVPENLYRISLVFGLAGYGLTALSSLLCLPLTINIFRNSLYTRVEQSA